MTKSIDYSCWGKSELIDHINKLENTKMKNFELGIKENTKWQNDELDNAYKSICTILGGRLTVSPEDYPPSEWRQYKENTKNLLYIRDLIEVLINLTI